MSRTLLNALQSGRLAHAFLFSGPRGSGKTTSARLLAKALNCHEGKPGEPCSHCVACVEIAAGNCMDVLEIDAASNRGIDEIRELKEKARYNPARDRNKIFIIDEVHMLTSEAFNALLKILEEPPPHVVFILATTEYHKIPATILSRCQQYSFKLIQYPLILNRLREIAKAEGIRISDSALEQVVFSSGGSMRDAMSALDQVIAFSGSEVLDSDVSALLGLVEPKVLSQTVHAIAHNDLATLLHIVGSLVEAGQDLNNFCRRLSGQLRNLMVLKAGISDPALLGIPESLLPDLRAQSELFSREDLLRLFDAFQKIETGMKYATQVRFQLEMGLIELAQVARLRSLEELVAEFSAYADIRPALGPDAAAPAARAPRPSARPVSHANPAAPPPPAPLPRPAASPVEAAPAPRAPLKDSVPAEAGDPGEFLQRIASAVGRESLETLMQSMAGAQLRGTRVVLDPGSAGEFVKNQVRQNLPLIAQAASEILGCQVSAVLGDSGLAVASGSKPVREKHARPVPPDAPVPAAGGPAAGGPAAGKSETGAGGGEGDLLAKAKQEPIVKSFLDVFPGPVKAEKIDK